MIGLTLGNRYLIEENIGIGGMAVVFRAKDTLLNRNVAVKVLKNEFMDDDEFVKKFAMEAQSAASLSHQNIVSVYDVGSSTIEDKKYNFIVMEYIDGRTLKEVIDEEGPLDPEYISKIGSQIASGLEAAHKNGVIHRDIKPHNILITNEGTAKVTDFGIARISSSATITYTSTVLGTVHYISPEQAKGKFIDEKSDIYSLGVVLYEMATGKTPFDAENAVGIALKHIQDPLVEAKSINKEIPDGLNDIIIKAMEKDPTDRFKNATEFKIALLNYRNFKLNDNGEGKTERLGAIKDEDIEDRRNKAVYNMPTDEDDEDEEEEEKGVFKTYVLPILLAVAVLAAALIIFNVFFKGNGTVKVPALTGMTYKDAEAELKKKDLEIAITGDEPDDLDNSKVISQDPEENTEIKKGETVTVEVEGSKEEKIPDLSGYLASDALDELRELGFDPKQQEEFSDTVEKGKVTRTDPAAGETVDPKSGITVYVSKGKEDEGKVEVPDVVGFSSSEAKKQLESSGLSWTTTSSYSNDYSEGKVTSQNVSGGTKVDKGSSVEINISKGKEPVETKTTQARGTVNVKIDVASIAEGQYKLKVEVYSNGQTSIPYNETLNTNDGNKTIAIEGYKGDSYTVYINGEDYKSGTIN